MSIPTKVRKQCRDRSIGSSPRWVFVALLAASLASEEAAQSPSADAEGATHAKSALEVRAREGRGAVRLTLEGSVVDADGRGIADARVGLMRDPFPHTTRSAWWTGMDAQPEAWVTCDEAGRFTVPASAGFYLFIARAPGHAPVGVWMTPLLDDRILPAIVLEASEEGRVEVRGADDTPLENALVVVQLERRQGGRWRAQPFTQPRIQATRTSADGVAKFLANPDDAWDLKIAAEGYVSKVVASAGRMLHTVRLTRGAPIEVIARTGTTPRPDVLITTEETTLPLAVTGDDGRATLHAAPGSRLRIVALAPNGDFATRTLDVRQASKAGAAADKVQQETIALEPLDTVEGRVVDAETREGVAHAWVHLHTEIALSYAQADAQGHYQLPVGGERPYISAAAVGYRRAGAWQPGSEGPVLALTRVLEIDGVVVDVDGQPVADVRVQVRGADARGGRDQASTDETGRFRLGHLRAGQNVHIRARKGGFADGTLELTLPDDEGGDTRAMPTIEIVLTRGLRVVGTVVDVDEVPIAGAEVTLRPDIGTMRLDGAFFNRLTAVEPRTAISDAEGRFAFDDLGRDTFALRFRRSGFASMQVPGVRTPETGDEAVDIGTVVMVEGAAVYGIAVDAEGAPLGDVKVSVPPTQGFMTMRRDDDAMPQARTGVDGRWRIEDLRPDAAITLTAQRNGFVTAQRSQVAVPNVEPVRIVLEAAVILEGVVVDDAGSTVARANVMSQPEGGHRSNGVRSAQTDDDGRFVLEDLPPGRFTIRALAHGKGRGNLTGLEIASGVQTQPLRIVLLPGAAVHGRIRAVDGTPIIGAMIEVETNDRSAMRLIASASMATSDDEGAYRVEGLQTGHIRLHFSHDGYKPLTRAIEIAAEDAALDVVLERGLPITGTVVDPEGNPVAGAAVTVWGVGAATMRSRFGGEVLSKADGRFEVVGLDNGEVMLRASAVGFASGEAMVTLAGQPIADVELRLGGGGGSIFGRVEGLAFDDLAAVQIFAMPADQRGASGRPLISAIDHEGTFRIDDLGAGTWQVMASLGQSRMQSEIVTVAADEEVEVVFDFDEGLVLTGVVLRAGVPVSGLRVMVSRRDRSALVSGATDQEGRFHVGGLAPAQYDVIVVGADADFRPLAREQIDLTTSEDLVLEVATQSITGRVLDRDTRQPIIGARVHLEPVDSSAVRFMAPSFGTVSTSQDGSFVLDATPAGRWRVRFEKDGYATDVRDLDVQADAAVAALEVELGAPVGARLRVVRADGRQAGSVFVSALDGAGRRVTSGTVAPDGNGIVRLPSLSSGQYQLSIAAPGTATEHVTVEVPGPDRTIALRPGGTLTVRVPDAANLAGAELRVTGARGVVRTVDAYELRDHWPLRAGIAVVTLGAGSVELEVTLPDGTQVRGQAVVVAGANTEVELR